MKLKAVSGIMLTLLLIGILSLTFNIQTVKASGTIYIRTDGSIDPPTANITSADNVTYYFTGNNYDEIVVNRSNIIIDGSGYTLQGTGGSGNGFSLSSISNVTIKNTNIRYLFYGIYLESSSNNVIYGNNITANTQADISLKFSNNNTLYGNVIANSFDGILLASSSNNTVYGNKATNNYFGIRLSGSNNNTINGNNFTDDGLFIEESYGNVVESNIVNGKPLVYLEGVSEFTVNDAGQVILVNCNKIRVEYLNLSNTAVSLQLLRTSNSKITNNNITNNEKGIWLYVSSNNTIYENKITNNGRGIHFWASLNNNTIHGNNIANNWAGIWFDGSSNNEICGNNMTNNRNGIFLEGSSNYNSISGNNITSAEWGIFLDNSRNNTIYGNNVANNGCGILVEYSSGNFIFSNNFVNNGEQVSVVHGTSPSINVWDDGYPSGGNYWSDYTDVDLNNDGIWDHPYVIDENNQDRYPLVNPWTPTPTIRYVIPTAIIKVRSYPGIPENDANVITKLPKGSVLQIVEHPDNGKFVDGYHWWYVKFGIVKGWAAEEYLKEYDFPEPPKAKAVEGVLLTAYYVPFESELMGNGTVTNPHGITGTFYREFLYSAKGVCMQGSGRAIDGRTIKWVSGGWIEKDGYRYYWVNRDLKPTRRLYDDIWSNGRPYWIADETSVIFEGLPENIYKGSFWDVYPWYSVAVDKDVIPIGSIVYIAELDGWTLRNGERLNGYFVATDTGGAIIGNRIDVFVGAGNIALQDWWDIQNQFKDKIDPVSGKLKLNVTYDDGTRWTLKQTKLKSPGELRVYDSQNRVTGVVNGEIKNEIPNSGYNSIDNTVTIVFPTDSYRHEVAGTEEGLYGLTVTSITELETITFTAIDIPTSANAIHQYSIDWDALSRGEEGVTVRVDSQGDGIFEHTFTSDSELTQSEYMTAVYGPTPPPTPVGGKATPINIPINKPETPTLWIWLSAIILPLIATAIFVKHKKKKQ